MVNFNKPNFDYNRYFNESGIQGLENISSFIDFGIHSTIIKQLGNIDDELENKHAINLLISFTEGNKNVFTNSFDIRKTIDTIEPYKIVLIFIKSAIERYAFNIINLNKKNFDSNEDKIAETIVEQIIDGNLDSILDWINTDERILPILIENYIYMSYKKDNQLRKVYNYIVSNCNKAKKAMKRLNSLMDYIKN